MENNNRTPDDILNDIDQLVNKEEILEVLDTLAIKANAMTEKLSAGESADLSFSYHNYLFTGNPGTEKTEAAQLFAEVLYAMGYVQNDEILIVNPVELSADTEVEIRSKVELAFNRAKGGILYIDDFNYLYDDSDDLRKNIILESILMNLVERSNDQVVILSGYEREVNKIMEANPMLYRRIYQRIKFRDYTAEELMALLMAMAESEGYELTEDACMKALEKFKYIWATRGAYFENSRVVERIFSEVKSRMAKRLMARYAGSAMPDEAAFRIEADDIPE